ncbi:DUF2897 family protein [Aliidiomarina celeris]|uniref:DUF2897 family protein n=1 Tax=Aliidiomarina celeris TaxID=2249428 RepID=UPI000DEA4AF5|nr:DUF2897 family protein [Aliidiomarina celeris]
MPTWGVVIIITLVLGIIWSNIILVKKTANMKMPDLLKKQEALTKASEEQNKNKEQN